MSLESPSILRQLRMKWDLQENIEDVLGERRMKQEEEDDNSGDAAIQCFLPVSSDISKPE